MNLKSWDRTRDTCVCVESLKLTLMGLNFLCPGASTLITNLCGSSGASEIHLLPSEDDLADEPLWKQEYLEGPHLHFTLPAAKPMILTRLGQVSRWRSPRLRHPRRRMGGDGRMWC